MGSITSNHMFVGLTCKDKLYSCPNTSSDKTSLFGGNQMLSIVVVFLLLICATASFSYKLVKEKVGASLVLRLALHL